MQMASKLTGKMKFLLECKKHDLPVSENDSLECLELIYSLAKANNWEYKNDGSENDIKIEKTIKKIRNFIENGYYKIN